MAVKRRKKMAFVNCCGGENVKRKVAISDIKSCNCQEVLEEYPEGVLECEWGCLGMGSCVQACKFGAIFINESGLAEVDKEKCIGCNMCAKVCPKGLIHMIAPENTIMVHCANCGKGGETRKACQTGCIACMICEKNCPVDAIHVIDNHAVIDEAACITCGMCAVKCPRGTIRDADGIFTMN